jgi:hypothetical protein
MLGGRDEGHDLHLNPQESTRVLEIFPWKRAGAIKE